MATPTNASQVSLVFTDPYLGVQRNVKELGSGVEQIVLAAYAGERLPANGTLVIEEPESHLHPDAQRRFLPHLLRWADDRLVLVSTHSTVLLDQGTAGGASVWLIERREGVATIRQADAVLPEVLAVLGVRLSDVLSAERVVVVEGTSDADVLRVFFDRELIAARANLVAGGRGGDAAWHVEAFSDWYAASDVLDRDITFVRDRDELSDEDVRRLEQTGRVRVLGRRELENYLLDEPDALGTVIARRLQEAGAPNAAVKSADVEKRIRDAADSLKATLVLKRVVAELGPLRLLDRATVKSLVEGKASATALAASIRERQPDIESKADEVLSIWDAVEAKVNDEWKARWRQLAPGADVLSQVFAGHGLEFSKTKDAVAIAREMQEPPDDLRAILGAVLSLSPEE